jgi:hypothetical protein
MIFFLSSSLSPRKLKVRQKCLTVQLALARLRTPGCRKLHIWQLHSRYHLFQVEGKSHKA